VIAAFDHQSEYGPPFAYSHWLTQTPLNNDSRPLVSYMVRLGGPWRVSSALS